MSCINCYKRASCLVNLLTEEEVKIVQEEKETFSFSRDQVIIREGARAGSIGLIKSGVIKLNRSDRTGIPKLLDISFKNMLFGTEALVQGNKYSYTVLAFNSVSVCFIPRDVIVKLYNDNIKVGHYLSDYFMSFVARLFERVHELSGTQAEPRVAKILLYMNDCAIYSGLDEFEIRRNELAEISGLSRETISRILARFREKKLIEIKGKKISVTDLDKLVKISEM